MKEIVILIKGFLKKNRKHFLFPFLSILIGVWGMIVVISVIKGFDVLLIRSITSFNPHITIFQQYNKKIPEEISRIKFSTYQGFFNIYGKKIGASLMEVDDITIFKKLLVKGSFEKAVIGNALAQNLNIDIGDNLNLIYTDDSGNIKMKILKVSGIFKSGIYIVDSAFILQESTKKSYNYIGIYLKNPEKAQEIKSKYLNGILATTWEEQNENFAKAVEMDSYFAMLITFFVVFMSGFSISNSVMYSIFVRKREIGILKSLGMGKQKIAMVFIGESMIIALVGFVFGSILSIITVKILENVNIPIPQNIFYIDKIPFYLSSTDIILAFIFITLLSFTFSFISSRKLLSFDIVEVLHGE
ncbi:hypothetical protein XO10_02575 [Marinitoga sp. 1135]|uniref:ABC transporter permease n=1 Tax=Marinitoga sp. 1135 TaxID=1643333 RepID=UPI001586A1FB|nr:FtsX-like permease family protein [Marinitoga sp. 1135]NUU95177.1 hypothetical protein [Marinitoga sp. 1135]